MERICVLTGTYPLATCGEDLPSEAYLHDEDSTWGLCCGDRRPSERSTDDERTWEAEYGEAQGPNVPPGAIFLVDF